MYGKIFSDRELLSTISQISLHLEHLAKREPVSTFRFNSPNIVESCFKGSSDVKIRIP